MRLASTGKTKRPVKQFVDSLVQQATDYWRWSRRVEREMKRRVMNAHDKLLSSWYIAQSSIDRGAWVISGGRTSQAADANTAERGPQWKDKRESTATLFVDCRCGAALGSAGSETKKQRRGKKGKENETILQSPLSRISVRRG